MRKKKDLQRFCRITENLLGNMADKNACLKIKTRMFCLRRVPPSLALSLPISLPLCCKFKRSVASKMSTLTLIHITLHSRLSSPSFISSRTLSQTPSPHFFFICNQRPHRGLLFFVWWHVQPR